LSKVNEWEVKMDKKEKINGKDLLLLLLYVPGNTGREYEPIRGRTRLTKMIFIFEKEIYKKFEFVKILPANVLPEFKPYKYGPFAKEIYFNIEFFQNIDFINVRYIEYESTDEAKTESEEFVYWEEDIIIDEDTTDMVQIEEFYLTKTGKEYVKEKIVPILSHNQLEVLKKFKSTLNGISLQKILKYVYNKYPRYCANSEIKEKILNAQ